MANNKNKDDAKLAISWEYFPATETNLLRLYRFNVDIVGSAVIVIYYIGRIERAEAHIFHA